MDFIVYGFKDHKFDEIFEFLELMRSSISRFMSLKIGGTKKMTKVKVFGIN